MNKCLWRFFAGFCVLAMFAVWAVPAGAQMSPVKAKPPMYTYVANWAIPRAQWGDMEKEYAASQKILDQALAKGTIVGYGNDEVLVHEVDGETHDDWWSAMSMAGLLNVLNEFYTSGNATTSILQSATKHWDNIYISRYYNWRSGSVKGGYTSVSAYQLKKDAPDNAVDTLSKNLIAPLLEKLLANGTIAEYEIDTQAVHTRAPGMFLIVYLTPTAEDQDKVNAAVQELLKSNPLDGPAFDSMVNFGPHRDELLQTNATYK
jgi:hypothetical protein